MLHCALQENIYIFPMERSMEIPREGRGVQPTKPSVEGGGHGYFLVWMPWLSGILCYFLTKLLDRCGCHWLHSAKMCVHICCQVFQMTKPFCCLKQDLSSLKLNYFWLLLFFIWQIRFKNEETVVAEEERDGEISILTESADYQKFWWSVFYSYILASHFVGMAQIHYPRKYLSSDKCSCFLSLTFQPYIYPEIYQENASDHFGLYQTKYD